MMSKQDYELVARAFKVRLDKLSHNTLSEGAALFMVEAFADVAAQQNPRFNRSMFYAACGIRAAEQWLKGYKPCCK